MSPSERQTILHMRVCGKILKRELRKEGKRNAEMTSEYINALLDEDVHSAESDESSIDSASVNHIPVDDKPDQEEMNSAEVKPSENVVEEKAATPFGSLFGVLFCFYMICIMISDCVNF